MKHSFQALTTFSVEDDSRPWGRVRDLLIEYPSCRNRYLGVSAHIGPGVKEIWAPIENMVFLDWEQRLIHLRCHIDRDLLTHLDRLEAPSNDTAELRLHRLYGRRPEWAFLPAGGEMEGRRYRLRRNSRLLRASSLLSWESMTRDGHRGSVGDILLQPEDLQPAGFELRVSLATGEIRQRFLLNRGQAFLLDRRERAIYLDEE